MCFHLQENPLMHNGHPCVTRYPNEYFEDGITNGANWYNVPGKPTPFVLLYYSPYSFSATQEVSQITLTLQTSLDKSISPFIASKQRIDGCVLFTHLQKVQIL